MSKKNSEYWKERFVILEESQMQKGANYYTALEREFQKASLEMQKDIEHWYQRFADNNKITMAEARKILTGKELEELRWNVKDYIQYGKENALNQKWMKELENASARYHISRLESLQLQLQQHAEVLFGNHLDDTDKLLREIYQGGYYKAAFELQKGLGVGTSFERLDTRRIDKVLTKPWTTDNRTFSDRIWTNKEKLLHEVHNKLTQNIIRGSSPDKTIKELAKQMNVSTSQAGRLIMTESAFFASAAQKDCFEELGVEKFEIVAALDSHTCGECGSLEGIPIDMKEYAEGITAPPFHPNCRCVATPYFDNEFSQRGKRIARDEGGKTYEVPANMTYPQWKEKFVDRNEESDIFDHAKQKVKSAFVSGAVGSYTDLPESIRVDFEHGLQNANAFTRKILEQEMQGTDFFLRDTKNSFDSIVNAIGLRPDVPPSTVAHELFHKIDKKYKVVANTDFKEVLRKDWNALIIASDGNIQKHLMHFYPEAFQQTATGKVILKKEYRGISDIISGLSKGKIYFGYRHKRDYWIKSDTMLPKEAWAQFGRITYENNKKVVKMLQELFPNFNETATIALKELMKNVGR